MTAGEAQVHDDIEVRCDVVYTSPLGQSQAPCPEVATWSHVCRSCRKVTLMCGPCHIARNVVSLWAPHVCDCGSSARPEMTELHPKGTP